MTQASRGRLRKRKTKHDKDFDLCSVSVTECSENGRFLNTLQDRRFCHFQKTTAPVDWA